MRIVRVDGSDPRVADYRNLTDVQWRSATEPAAGMFLAEGAKVIMRAVAGGFVPRSALTAERWLPALAEVLAPFDVEVLVAEPAVVESIVGFRLHRGALAAFERRPAVPPQTLLADAHRIVICENLVDHTNVGLIFRTAAALGMDAVLISPSCADPYYRRALKTSMGAVCTMPWTVLPDWPDGLRRLAASGWDVVALSPDASAQPLDRGRWSAQDRVALVLGSEGPGLTPAAMAHCTRRLRIPVTSRVDSLNVAAAAAIACYEVVASAEVTKPPVADGRG